jgi:hypothetical protein
MSDTITGRPLTEDEVRERFLAQVWVDIREWEKYPDKTVRERLEGAAFSILASLDGASIGLPRFSVSPSPHESDKQFSIENGIDWWSNDKSKVMKGVWWPETDCDISGGLHELFYDVGRKKGYVKDEENGKTK